MVFLCKKLYVMKGKRKRAYLSRKLLTRSMLFIARTEALVKKILTESSKKIIREGK